MAHMVYVFEQVQFGLPRVISASAAALDDERGSVSVLNPGSFADVLTRDELLATEEGRRALSAWEAGDLTDFEAFERRCQVEAYREVIDELAPTDAEARRLAGAGYPFPEIERFCNERQPSEDTAAARAARAWAT